MKHKIIKASIHHPKLIIGIAILITFIFLGAFPGLQTDSDPVHMLPSDNEAVLLHNKIKKEFQISDIIAVGIQSKSGNSLFTVKDLKIIDEITSEILKIKDEENKENPNIFIVDDVISISTSSDIVKNKNGELYVDYVMKTPPTTEEAAHKVLTTLNENPILGGKIVSKDGSLISIYLPLNEGMKSRSYYLGNRIEEIMKEKLGEDKTYFFAGLPISESTFGSEMFVQMAIYAPMAGLVIFCLMYFFFRNVHLVAAPMVLGVMAVIWSMGALIYTGNVIHIMSSMIPIFILPIAVLDSIHILSSLNEHLPDFKTREEAVTKTIEELFNPMFYTSLTTIVGFASLATTGIPPVIVFGITIAFGVFMSFLLTITLIPAFTMIMSEKTLKSFKKPNTKTFTDSVTGVFKYFSYNHPKKIITIALVVVFVSILGIQKIIINDNPVRWFKTDHPLRIADGVMNKKLAGTYMTNLYFALPEELAQQESSDEDDFSDEEEVAAPSIKDPAVIAYIDKVQTYLLTLRGKDGEVLIGGATSVVNVLKKIGTIAVGNDTLPTTREEISQYIFLYESGDIKKGKDLWRLMTPNESLSTHVWLFFKSGDNQNMIYVAEKLKEFMKKNPAPSLVNAEGKEQKLEVKWSGLMHINKIWQNEMVSGMMEALVGSFIIVFIMMSIIFRSVRLAVVSMLPLTLTIMAIYGLIGHIGKFYDMPIAVLSSLTLGLSVDFAIHFIEHAKQYKKEHGDFDKVFDKLFGGAAQAIWRNIMVVAIGFTPLLFAGLNPYITVGSFFLLIMFVSGVSTLLLIPSILRLFHKFLLGA